MRTCHSFPGLAVMVCLTLTAVLAQPSRALACNCGPGCRCGPSCSCGTKTAAQEPGVEPLSPATADLRVRRNATTLTDQERQDFIDAVRALKDVPAPSPVVPGLSIYDNFVVRHAQAFFEGSAHGGPAFFPWHRQFLLEFEQELQRVNPSVNLPYWDFTDPASLSILFASNFLGGNGDPERNFIVTDGPFRAGEWVLAFDGPDLRRQFGFFVPTLPTQEQVLTALGVTPYDVFPFDRGSPIDESFRNHVEGFNHPGGEQELHNRVHLWLGGSSSIDLSPNDPIFYLLHANIDRIWAEWEMQNGLSYLPISGPREGHRLFDPMFPFFDPVVRPVDVLDHHLLGYRYDTEPLGPAGAVPEPAGLVLFVLGGLVLMILARRRWCAAG